ncbi:conserved hypothetical protein [Roseibium sp. TrichSKD4]|uniref:SRPBCC family protein n=1 Tax=Roseibium sp. TrichSKD4 TaxID=744980 RepID=UPI0001E56B6D|nr:SRPBCC family protein [Roseibium sp. TrichSKD4]EFO30707.1 conserved hypothetical protein [Roseibium sp. TrichSKD4]
MNIYLTAASVLVAGLVIIPYLLPSSKTVTRQAVIDAPSDTVYALVSSNEGYQTFNPYKAKDPDLKITLSGPEHGVGSSFAFDGKEGKGSQTITSLTENKSVTMQIDLGAMGQPICTFDLEAIGANQTRVTWSTRSDFGMTPIGRVFGLFLDGMLGPDYELGLKLLGKAATTNS